MMTKNKDRYFYYSWLIIILSAVSRLLMIGKVGLGDDEAHYWMWSKNLDWSYFDHPPMVAWVIAFFTAIGGDHEFFVRVGAVLLFLITSWGAYFLAAALKDQKTGFFTVVFLNISPVFSFLGSVLMVPDGPLAAAWVLFLIFFYKALQIPHFNKYWVLTGIALGIGALSKYNAVLLPISAFLYLLLSKQNRFWVLRKEPYIALGIGVILSLPVVYWNAQNHWASFGFQLNHGIGEDHSFSSQLFFQILGAQIGYISPILFFLAWIAVILSGIKGIKYQDERYLFLFCFAAPTLFLFNGIGAFHKILPHWPALGFITAFIALALWIVEDRPKIKLWVASAVLLGISLTLLVPIQALFMVLPYTKSFTAKVDPTNDLYGWPEAASRVNFLQAKMNSKEGPTFIYSNKFLIADQIGFYTGKSRGVYCFNEDKSQYDFWDDPGSLKGQNAIFVTDNRYQVDPVEKFGKNFEKIEKEAPIDIYRKGVLIRTFYLYRCYGFKGIKI
ncbi:MAG: glycosyltransferase family 39 protein [Nitrospirae bacterium]|nr:glycosyltransferase family 39 protein [Nitrospirota bacterium]